MSNMKNKFSIVAVIFLIAIIALYLVFDRYEHNDYSFVYPRSWFINNIQGSYFNGLILSDRNIADDQTDFDRGGYVHISFEEVESNLSVENYIKELKDSEAEKIKTGGLPTIPGPSQYEYKGISNIGLKGFHRVISLSALPDDINTRLYWKISNKKLYQVFIKCPQNEFQTTKFKLAEKLFFLTFDAK